jgi:hypothetical protein
MGVYIDISFNAKLTNFGYEIVQELYRNRNECKLPTVELYQEEKYDNDGNLIASNHIELEKICTKYNKLTFLIEYSSIKLFPKIMFGQHSSLKKDKCNSILTEDKKWIFCTCYKASGVGPMVSDDGLEELLSYVISEPVEYKCETDACCGPPLIKIIKPVDTKEYKELDIINGRIVGRR